MDTKQVGMLLEQNRAMYRQCERPITDRDIAIQAKIWAVALRDIPFETAQAAMVAAFQVCRFPVTLADLTAQLRTMSAAQDISAPECWEQLKKGAKKAVNNAAGYGYTLRLEDGRTQGQAFREANKEIFRALHPAAQAWLGSVSELVRLGELDADALSFRRREFERAFAAYQAQKPLCISGDCDPTTLPAAQQNRLT